MSPSHKATATWSQYIQAQTDTQRLGDRKKNEEREAEMEKRERKIKRGREMESKAEGDKDRMRQKMRSKQQEWEKQVTEESLLVSPGCGPPPCYSLVSIATGRAAQNLHIHLHPFCLHNSTGFCAYS